jgi:REP element-mobilizing transposase RayT
MELNAAGEKVREVWYQIPRSHPHAQLDAFVVMPNHVHFILILRPAEQLALDTGNPRRRHGIGEMIRGFKSFSAIAINRDRGTLGARVWHRNYYEHIVRDGAALASIRRYIARNPSRWRE